jgi:hypothetical protein
MHPIPVIPSYHKRHPPNGGRAGVRGAEMRFSIKKSERGPAVSSPRQKGGKHMEMKMHRKKEMPNAR